MGSFGFARADKAEPSASKNLRRKLSITSGRPSRGILSRKEVQYFSDEELETALRDLDHEFKILVANRTVNAGASASYRRRLSQLALNKRVLDTEMERRQRVKSELAG
jgi:precorrin isomerase